MAETLAQGPPQVMSVCVGQIYIYIYTCINYLKGGLTWSNFKKN